MSSTVVSSARGDSVEMSWSRRDRQGQRSLRIVGVGWRCCRPSLINCNGGVGLGYLASLPLLSVPKISPKSNVRGFRPRFPIIICVGFAGGKGRILKREAPSVFNIHSRPSTTTARWLLSLQDLNMGCFNHCLAGLFADLMPSAYFISS